MLQLQDTGEAAEVVFDPIMQVGKQPQITEDIRASPLAFGDDISSIAAVSTRFSAAFTQTGSVLNILNPNFDYVSFTAYQATTTATDQRTAEVVFDLGREVNIRYAVIYWAMSDENSNASATIDISSDGSIWINKETQSTDGTYTSTVLDSVFRYFRIKFTPSASAGSKTLTVNRAIFLLSSIQRFY